MSRRLIDERHAASCTDDSQPLPVAVLFDGRMWLDVDVRHTFDNLISAGVVPPLLAAMVVLLDGKPGTEALWQPRVFLPFLLNEVMPFLAERWHITGDPSHTVVIGQSMGGLAAAYTGLHASHRFGLVLSQSGSFW